MLLAQYGYAQNYGTGAVPFIRISPTARASGMGDAYVALSDDIGALYYNPAGIAQIKNMEVLATYVLWFEEMKNHYIGFVLPFKRFAIGTSVTFFTMGEIESADNFNVLPTPNQIYDVAGTLSFGHELVPDFLFWGVTLKGIYEKLGPYNTMGFAADIGTIMKIQALSLGLAVQNIGPKLNISNVSNSLPMEIKGGVALKLLKDQLILSTDILKPSDANLKFRVGSEYTWNKSFILRAGYQGLGEVSKLSGFTAGLGFKTSFGTAPGAGGEMSAAPGKKSEVEIDYAILNSGELGFVHYVSAILRI